MRKCYKAVQVNNDRSWYDNRTEWIPGKVVSMPEEYMNSGGRWSTAEGLYCCPDILQSLFYAGGLSNFFEVEPLIIDQEYKFFLTKFRCASIRVIRQVPRRELNRMAGFDLWELNHPVFPLFLEPDRNIPYKDYVHHLRLVRNLKDVGFSSLDYIVDNYDEKYHNIFRDYLIHIRCYMKEQLSNLYCFNSNLEEAFDYSTYSYGAFISLLNMYTASMFGPVKKDSPLHKLGKYPLQCIRKLFESGYLPVIGDNKITLLTTTRCNNVYETDL